MKIAALNDLPNGSPARIMHWISELARSELNAEVYEFYGIQGSRKSCNPNKETNSYGNRMEVSLGRFLSKSTGIHGIWNFFGTVKLIRTMEKINPDLIHLHNIHLWNINLPILFRYIKKRKLPVVWTLHDCWSFTGQCPYFTVVNCNKWKEGCYKCPQLRRYPGSYIDHTRLLYHLKKKWFTGISNLTLVTPSEWLLSLVKESYLKGYQSVCINNGIDFCTFHKSHGKIRDKYCLQKKKIILGVAFDWGFRKGLDIFIELSKRLDERYVIILVGIEEKHRKSIPDNIICIERTENQMELAELYSDADVFFNPTREDNFPTVNIEALSCGTPVITFCNGGSSEMIDESCGIALNTENIDIIKANIETVVSTGRITSEACIGKAQQYKSERALSKYIMLYETVLKNH